MKTKIYVVMTGKWDDYDLDSLWSTKELAEARRQVILTDLDAHVHPVSWMELDDMDGLKVP